MYARLEDICEEGITVDEIIEKSGYPVEASGSCAPLPSKRNDIIALCPHFEQLRETVGTSSAKMTSIIGVAASWNEISSLLEEDEIDDEALRDALTRINGIGTWSVDMILMFKFFRPDIWPVGDLAFRKGISIVFGLKEGLSDRKKEDVAEFDRIGKMFQGYRSLVAWYMYKLVDDDKKNKKNC
jgi:DNA-3-methyladenine glycosylase II